MIGWFVQANKSNMTGWFVQANEEIWFVDLFRQFKWYNSLICSGKKSYMIGWFVQVRCTWRLARPRRLSAGTRKPWRPRLTTSQPTWPWPSSFIKRWAISVSHFIKRARCSPPSPPDHGQAIQPTWISLCKLLL